MKIDLLDPENFRYEHPYELYRWLRENDPVHWHEEHDGGAGFWALTRHADVRAVEADSDTFSSEPVTIIPDGEPFGDADHKLLIYSDAPGHTVRRKFLGIEMQPIPVRQVGPQILETVTEIIDEVIERGECELVDEVAGRLASFVIADMMGLTREEALELFPAAEILTRGISSAEGIGLEATQVVYKHAGEAWARFHGNPDAGGMLARLANGEVDGKPMDELQFMLDFLILINAGSDTTRNLVASGMWALMQNPEAYKAMSEDATLVPNAVEEILRWTPPISYQRRTATRDVEIDGTLIKKGDKVVVWYGAANRDPEAFTDPETFDIHRGVNPHMTFGGGRHFCLGSHLARLELVTMFTELTRRIPDMRLTGPVGWLDYPYISATAGPHDMPVAFTPGERLGSGKASSAA